MSTPRELSRPDEFSRTNAVRTDEPSPGAIRAEIERTRGRLGETVEALGAQLNPSLLKQRVKDSVREATIGRVQYMARNTRERITETGRGLAQTIRDNPVPAAIAATGISWLLFNRERPRERFVARFADETEEAYRRRVVRDRVRDAGEDAYERARELRAGGHEVAREFSEDVSERFREVRGERGFGEEVGERARDYRSGAREFGEEVRDRGREIREKAREIIDKDSEKAQRKQQLADTAHRVAERAREARERVAERARAARQRVAASASAASRRAREGAVNTAHAVEDRYKEAPIGMGALALAAGLAIGFSMRQSRRGGLGAGRREGLVDRARERISEAGDRFEGAIDRASSEARSYGREIEEGLGG